MLSLGEEGFEREYVLVYIFRAAEFRLDKEVKTRQGNQRGSCIVTQLDAKAEAAGDLILEAMRAQQTGSA